MTKITLNLPCADLYRSLAFFKALGFCEKDGPQYGGFIHDDCHPCLEWSPALHIILFTHQAFLRETQIGPDERYKPIHDAHTSTGALYVLPVDSVNTADRLCQSAVRVGLTRLDVQPPLDNEDSYTRSVEDPDGRLWCLIALKGKDEGEDEGTSRYGDKHGNAKM